jgi:hypothetical protein
VALHRRTLLRSSLGLAVAAGLLAGCGVPSSDEQVLLRFFRASRLYDVAAIEKVALVAFNPVTDGIVQDFVVAGVKASEATREVTIDAQVRRAAGVVAGFSRPLTVTERLVVTMERRDGRWLITGITRPPASQTSPAASSAPPY